MPSFVDFAELKEKVPIEDVLPMLGIAGAGNSAQWRGSCPGCESGGDRALVVTPAKKAFYCFATRKGGDVIALVAHVQGISMKDAALAIAEYCGTVPVQESGNSNSTRNSTSVQPPVFGPPFKLVSGDAFSAPSAVLPKVQEVDNSEQNVV